MSVARFIIAGQTIGIALIANQCARQYICVVSGVCPAILRPLDQVDVDRNGSGFRIDEQQLAYAVRLLLVGHLDAPGKTGIAVARLQHFGIDDPQLRPTGTQSGLCCVVPLCDGCHCQSARLAPIYVGPDIDIKVDTDFSAHGDDSTVLIHVHQQLTGENGNTFVQLAVAMAGTATGFGLVTHRTYFLSGVCEPEHRSEVLDSSHAGNIRTGHFIYRWDHQGHLGPRADEANPARARVGLNSNVLRFEIGDSFGKFGWRGCFSAN